MQVSKESRAEERGGERRGHCSGSLHTCTPALAPTHLPLAAPHQAVPAPQRLALPCVSPPCRPLLTRPPSRSPLLSCSPHLHILTLPSSSSILPVASSRALAAATTTLSSTSPSGLIWEGRFAVWASSAPPGAPEERKVQGRYNEGGGRVALRGELGGALGGVGFISPA